MTRRSWFRHLSLLVVPLVYGAGVVVGALRFLSPLPSKPREPRLDAGRVDEFSPNRPPKVFEFNDRKVYVLHDGAAIRAFDAECTHLACNVVIHDDVTRGFKCHCHGARFDRRGEPTAGPTKVPLEEFELADFAGGQVIVLDRIKKRERA